MWKSTLFELYLQSVIDSTQTWHAPTLTRAKREIERESVSEKCHESMIRQYFQFDYLMYVTTQQITHNYQRQFIFGIVFCASLIKRVVSFFFVLLSLPSYKPVARYQSKKKTTKIDENRRRTIRLLYLQLNWSIWNRKQKENDKNVFLSWRSPAWQIWFMEMLMIFLYLLFSFVRLDFEVHCSLGMSHKISKNSLESTANI